MKKITVVLALLLLGATMLATVQRGGATLPASVGAGPEVGGKLAYARGGALWLYSGGEQRQLTKGPQDKQDKRDAMPAFSPNGSQIVYTRFDEGYSDLYKLEVANPTKTTAITSHKPPVEVGKVDPNGRNGYANLALWALFPAWSPDGDSLAYTTDIGIEYPGLFLMNPNGSNERRVSSLDHSAQAVESPSWSPDAGKIAVANYVGTKGGLGQIWVLNLSSGKWTAITEAKDGAYDPAWSPDGEWIAFTMRDGAANNIYVVPSDPEKWDGALPTPVKLTGDGASRTPAWSPDGSRLAYISLHDGSFDLRAGNFSVTNSGEPALSNLQLLTDKADVDAASGLNWGK